MPPTRVQKSSASALPTRLIPRKKPSQERSRSLVDAIVVAASRVLADRGWDGFAMKDVAKLAGVSSGSLYQDFPDRASLVAEVVERLSLREVGFQLEHAARIAPEASIEDVMQAIVSSTLAFQAREGALMRQALAAMPHLGRHALLVARVQSMTEGMRAMFAARAPHLSPRELDVTLHVLVNAVHSLTHDGVLPRPDWLDDEALTRELVRLVHGYLAR